MSIDSASLIIGMEQDLIHDLTTQVRVEVARKREQAEEAGRTMGADDERRFARSVVLDGVEQDRARRVMDGIPALTADEEQQVIDAVTTAVFGNGSLSGLMSDPDVWEINVNSPWAGDTFVQTLSRGKVQITEQLFADNDEIREWVTHIGLHKQASGTRTWDAATGVMECQLHDPTDKLAHNARIVAMQGASPDCQMSIRLLRNQDAKLDDFVRWGSCTQQVTDFLRALTLARGNVLLVGMTGSGKTTMARALTAEIPSHERIILMEHFTELGGALHKKDHPDLIVWQEREGNAEGVGALELELLVSKSRRFNPRRLILGEVMGPEIVPFLRALTQGNDGGITTLHARGLPEVLPRLIGYAAEYGVSEQVAAPMIGMGVDALVFFEYEEAGDGTPAQRWISHVAEVDYNGERLVLNSIFEDDGDGIAVPKATVSEGLARRLRRVGWQAPDIGPGWL